MSKRQSETDGAAQAGRESSGYMRLEAWRFADELAVALFHEVKTLPPDLRWLAGQLVRAATSVPANIAEGYGRASNKEFLKHLSVARGSPFEVSYFIHFMARTSILSEAVSQTLQSQCQQASRVIYGLMKTVRANTSMSNNQRRYLRELPEVYVADQDHHA